MEKQYEEILKKQEEIKESLEKNLKKIEQEIENENYEGASKELTSFKELLEKYTVYEKEKLIAMLEKQDDNKIKDNETFDNKENIERNPIQPTKRF